MTINPTPQDDGGLQQLLREWRVEAPLPPRFQEQVWQRIARAERQAGVNAWARVWQLVEAVLARPKVAVSYVTVLLVCGVAGGSWAAQVKSRQTDTDLRVRYVQSVSPFGSSSLQP